MVMALVEFIVLVGFMPPMELVMNGWSEVRCEQWERQCGQKTSGIAETWPYQV